MLKPALFLTLLATPALAAPVITAPKVSTVQQTTQAPVSGVSVADVGAGALTTLTVTLTDTTGLLYAVGPSVTQPSITGSGTASVTLKGSVATVNAALGTLLDWPGATAADTITITATDGTNTASPASIAVTVTPDPHGYLTFPSLAAAQARSQQQCAALGCDGVFTVFWWPVVPTATGGAVQIMPGDPYYGPSATNKAGSGTLTPAEQSAVQTATQLGAAMPAPSASAVVATPR